MKNISKVLLTISFTFLLASCDWFDWHPPSQGNATLAIHVTTNTGGPSIGPLEGAPIHILRTDGSLAARGFSDKNGDVSFELDAGTYIVDPQDMPNDVDDFYQPPTKQNVILEAGKKLEIHLHYDNPIL